MGSIWAGGNCWQGEPDVLDVRGARLCAPTGFGKELGRRPYSCVYVAGSQESLGSSFCEMDSKEWVAPRPYHVLMK